MEKGLLRAGPPWIAAGTLLLACAVWLVPPGSWPAGWDVFWNLHVARRWAEGGFPRAFPEAWGTPFVEAYGDRQLLLHALIALAGGRDLGPGLVPPLTWLVVLLQGAGFVLAARLLGLAPRPWWLLLPWAASASFAFRASVLRDLPLALAFLVPLVAGTAARLRGRRVPAVLLGLLAALFGYAHAAWLAALGLCALTLPGSGRAGLRRAPAAFGALGLGFLAALVLRPEPGPHLRVLLQLNVDFPRRLLAGELPLAPSEFAPYAPAEWLRWNAPLALALLGLAAAPRGRACALPALCLGAAALVSRRFVEPATPFAVLALLEGRPRPPRGPRRLALLLLPLALLWNLHEAGRSLAANRRPELAAVARWLAARGRPGDRIFLADWALAAPLHFFLRDRGLRPLGLADPSFLAAGDRRAFAVWAAVVSGRAPEPAAAVFDRLGARFAVLSSAAAPPGEPAGSTIRRFLAWVERAQRAGRTVRVRAPRRRGGWWCFLVEPPR